MEEQALVGILERITYQNPENSFLIGRLQPEASRAPITVKGTMFNVHEGQTLKLWGGWEEHPEYGRQFAVIGANQLGSDVSRLWVLNVDGGNAVPLTDPWSLDWSPGAVTATLGHPSQPELRLLTPVIGKPRAAALIEPFRERGWEIVDQDLDGAALAAYEAWVADD